MSRLPAAHDLLIRVYALEHMVQRLFAIEIIKADGDPIATVDQMILNYQEKLSSELFPTDDPAQSDQVNAEVQEAFERLLVGVKADIQSMMGH